MDGDGKLDVVAVSEDAVVWYQNPSWRRHDIIRGVTEKDNVCIQPHDIDGDGRIDFALGAGWRPPDTARASTLQWLGRDKDGKWQVHPIQFDEPTLHRLRWGDVKGTGKKQLVVAPLQGRGTKGPNWGEGQGVRVLVYDVPADPSTKSWPVEVADQIAAHDPQPPARRPRRRPPRRGRAGLLGGRLRRWSAVERRRLDADPARHGQPGVQALQGGQRGQGRPHARAAPRSSPRSSPGTASRSSSTRPGIRTLTASGTARSSPSPLQWGHAVWCVNLDADKDDELIIGQRDPNRAGAPGPRGPGVFVFDIQPGTSPPTFARHTIDDGGMACEDALAADLDGDGKPDIIAGGRATHNVKIYWNRACDEKR